MEQKIAELLKEANEKYYNEDYSGAFDLYKEIIETEKKAYEPMIYITFCMLRSMSISDINGFTNTNNYKILSDAETSIAGSLENIKNRIGKDNREYIVSWLNIYRDFVDTIVFFHNTCVSYLQKSAEIYKEGVNKIIQIGSRDVNYSHIQQLHQLKDKFNQDWELAKSNYETIVKQLITLNNFVVFYINENIENFSLISSVEVQGLYDSVAKIYHLDEGEDIHTEKIKGVTQGLLLKLISTKNNAKSFEIKKYWEDKPERKKELEDMKEQYQNEKAEIHIKIYKLREEINKLEENINNSFKAIEEKKKTEIKNQNELIKQKNSLGLFKGKEKNLLQGKIDEIQNNIHQLNSQIDIEKTKAKEKYQPLIDEKNMKIKEFQNSIEEIEKKEKEIAKELYLKDDE